MNINKFRIVRERIYPRIYDATYILTSGNLKVFKRLLSTLKQIYFDSQTIHILDLGCGYKPFEELFVKEGIMNMRYIGVDFDNEKSLADIILDLNKDKIPINDNTIDIIILSEVLEHLYNPFNVIREATRLLKDGGFMYISTPFVFPYHGTPYDYYRYTEFFYKKLAEEFGYEIIIIQKSGTFISVPLYALNIFIEVLVNKLGLRFLGFFSHMFVNLIAIIFDKIFKTIGKWLNIEGKLEYMNCGVALIMRKIKLINL